MTGLPKLAYGISADQNEGGFTSKTTEALKVNM